MVWVAGIGRRIAWGVIAVVMAARATAHTLPISFLTVQPDADYLHVELLLNPAELNCFGELDTNKDGRIDSGELSARERVLTERIVQALVLIEGAGATGRQRPLDPEVAGINVETDGHHLLFRAHYRGNFRQRPFQIRSRLNELTSGSHVTHVTFAGNAFGYARLDMQTRTASFNAEAALPSAPQPRDRRVFMLGPGFAVIGFLCISSVALTIALWLRLRQSRNPV